MQNQRAIGLDEAQRNFLRQEIKGSDRFTELQWRFQEAMEAGRTSEASPTSGR